jgi:hypothetical protein
MNFSSTAVLESKTCPGVRVTVKKFSVARRAKMELELAEYREKTRVLWSELADCKEIPDEKDESGNIVQRGDTQAIVEQKSYRFRGALQQLEGTINQYLKPVVLRTYIKRIDDLLIDGSPATVETLIEDGPTELSDEVCNFIEQANSLSGEEAGESSLPTTLVAPVGGNPTLTSATDASAMDSTGSATAASISR